jgi:uncharacterized protein (TIGR02453 family)
MEIPQIIDFLKELQNNNNRDWFLQHKSEYEVVKKMFFDLTEIFINRISLFDSSIDGLEAKYCIYRINRDIRFSPDKTPYKDWMGAYIVKGGKKNMRAGYYVHLQSNSCLIAGGLHCPTMDWLTKVRQGISDNGAELVKLLNAPEYKKYFGDFKGEKLKKAPRDFSPNDKYIELIKYKTFDIVNYVKDSELRDINKFIDDSVEKFKLIKPINDFFNEILGLEKK